MLLLGIMCIVSNQCHSSNVCYEIKETITTVPTVIIAAAPSNFGSLESPKIAAPIRGAAHFRV